MLILLYDGWCADCTKTALRIKQLSNGDNVKILSFRNTNNPFNTKTMKQMNTVLHIYDTKKKIYYTGLSAVEILCKALPVLWIFLPAVKVCKLIKKENQLYSFLSNYRNVIPVGQCLSETCLIHSNLQKEKE